MFIIVGILVAIVIGLLIYNVQIHRKIQEFNSLQRQANNLRVLQDFLSTIGETSSVDDKIKKINDILIEKYEIKYSTIVVFDGAEYQIKATNVDQKHWETLRNLQDVPIFKDSIATATPKYITINNENEKLPYQTMEFARAKSAIFFPIYEDNVYIGYWIIESGIAHDFDNIDTTIFEVVKDNIVAVLKTVVHQKTLEAIVRKDLFTGLYSEEYLYGEGKKTIDQYTTSAVCMFRIANIEEINDKYDGYIKKAYKEVEKLAKLEEKQIPEDIDYQKVTNLASEARQKLEKIRPKTLAQASRISGVNPVDISVLTIYLKKEYGKNDN